MCSRRGSRAPKPLGARTTASSRSRERREGWETGQPPACARPRRRARAASGALLPASDGGGDDRRRQRAVVFLRSARPSPRPPAGRFRSWLRLRRRTCASPSPWSARSRRLPASAACPATCPRRYARGSPAIARPRDARARRHARHPVDKAARKSASHATRTRAKPYRQGFGFFACRLFLFVRSSSGPRRVASS